MSEFAIYELTVGKGNLAIAPMPGRGGTYLQDFSMVEGWRPDLVISMTPLAELEQHGAGRIGESLDLAGIAWQHMPVPDFGVPDDASHAAWHDIRDEALALLTNGKKVLVHCLGGCGRSGMVALRLMIAAGDAPDVALARLQKTRPCAVETDEQLKWAYLG